MPLPLPVQRRQQRRGYLLPLLLLPHDGRCGYYGHYGYGCGYDSTTAITTATTITPRFARQYRYEPPSEFALSLQFNLCRHCSLSFGSQHAFSQSVGCHTDWLVTGARNLSSHFHRSRSGELRTCTSSWTPSICMYAAECQTTVLTLQNVFLMFDLLSIEISRWAPWITIQDHWYKPVWRVATRCCRFCKNSKPIVEASCLN